MSSLSPDEVIEDIRSKFRKVDLWLVGGAARYMSGYTDRLPKDYDIIVPKECETHFKYLLENKIKIDPHCDLSEKPKYNWDGWKITEMANLYDADIWVGSVENYLAEVPTALDGIAMRISDNPVTLYTKEFIHAMYNGVNFEVKNRHTVKCLSEDYYKEHLSRQGISI